MDEADPDQTVRCPTEPVHHPDGVIVAGPHVDIAFPETLRHLLGVEPLHLERIGRHPLVDTPGIGDAVGPHPGHLGEAGEESPSDGVLVGGNLLEGVLQPVAPTAPGAQ